jgi:hypothetical protein
MNYNSMTKAQLIEYIEDLEKSSLELISELEEQTFGKKWEYFQQEVRLLGADLLKLVQFVYELGVAAGKQTNKLIDQIKAAQAVPQLVTVEVVEEVNTEFPY